MTSRDRVKRLLAGLHLLDADGGLKRLDSMGLIDLVVELENAFSVSIPPDRLQPDCFESLETISNLMEQVVDAAGTA